MKKIVNLAIIALAGVVLIWGIVAAGLTLANSNSKTYIAAAGTSYNYSSDGRMIVSTDVAEGNEYIQVKSQEAEAISQYEYYSRLAKYRKIVMDKAYETYKENDTMENTAAYNKAVADYNSALASKHSRGMSNFTGSASVFFGTYFPIIVLLGIGLLVNTKVEYKKKSAETVSQ